MGSFEENLDKLVALSTELKSLVRESHEVLKDLKQERRLIEKMLSDDVKKMVDDKVGEVVKTELDRIGPEIRQQSSLIYDRVSDQIDKLINLMLGNEFGSRKHADLRPMLAAKLREWLLEIVNEEV